MSHYMLHDIIFMKLYIIVYVYKMG